MKKQKLIAAVCILPVVAALAVLFPACASSQYAEDMPGGGDETHVVFIGLDGWGAYSLPRADMPVVKELMAEGSYTLEALGIMPSDSACNWASLFMGADPSLHGYTRWNSREPAFPPAAVDSHGFFPTIFAQLRDQRPESQIGYFYEWAGMKYLCPRDVPDRMRHFLLMSYVKTGVNSIARYIKKEKPTLTTVIFYKPDLIGHSKGHDTPEYYRGLHEADSYIGVLVQAVKDAGIYENTVFVLSADHGGDGTGHGGESMAERQIPVIFSGKNIQKGHYITAPVRNYDIAPTMARLLDIAAPDIWIGTSIDEVFIEPSQFN